jgi:hypothetical protein
VDMPPKKKKRSSAPVGVPHAPEESRWTRTLIRGEGVGQWGNNERELRAGKWFVNLNYWSGGHHHAIKADQKKCGLYDSPEEARVS